MTARSFRASTQPRYAVALYRVSNAEQGHSGLGLKAQQVNVRASVEREGWMLVAEHQDIASGTGGRHTGFEATLTQCRQLGAVLVLARLDRITRRDHTLSGVLEEGISIRAAAMPGTDGNTLDPHDCCAGAGSRGSVKTRLVISRQ
jgi:DNA invertase Pin-like site-specific DNA recombinase